MAINATAALGIADEMLKTAVPASEKPAKRGGIRAVIPTDDAITREAQYSCFVQGKKCIRGTGIGSAELYADCLASEREEDKQDKTFYQTAPVSIRVVLGEKPEETEKRFELAAEIERRGLVYTRKMPGCYSFSRFLPTAEEAAKAAQVKPVQKEPAQKNAPIVIPHDKCDDEWATRAVCYK